LPLFLFADKIAAQGIVSGKVYENINQLPIEGVSIRNKNTGGGELSDKFGFYSVNASAGDSIEVYILGYKRFKFKVTASASDVVKNVYLTIEKFNLPEVEVLARRNVTKDSLNNRRENAALFAYRRRSVGKAILGSFFNPVSSLQSLVDMGKNRRLKHFQAHLVAEERDNYIDSRFTRENVEEITGLKGKELEAFISSNNLHPIQLRKLKIAWVAVKVLLYQQVKRLYPLKLFYLVKLQLLVILQLLQMLCQQLQFRHELLFHL
jgi:hypothetical protein